MSLKELRQAAGLVCSADSLSRKLRGKQVLSIEEADAIAAVFNRKVTMARRRPKAA